MLSKQKALLQRESFLQLMKLPGERNTQTAIRIERLSAVHASPNSIRATDNDQAAVLRLYSCSFPSVHQGFTNVFPLYFIW